MISALSKKRLIGGWIFIVGGLMLCAMWARYVVWFQGLPDLLDLSPLAVAFAIFGLGIWLAPVRGLGSMIAFSYKRDMVLSVAFAALVEAVLGPVIYHLGIETPLILRLGGLQEPGARLAYVAYRASAPHLGRSWGRDVAVASGFLLLIALWTCGTFALLSVLRLVRRRRAGQQV